jgi:hypothetical protein
MVKLVTILEWSMYALLLVLIIEHYGTINSVYQTQLSSIATGGEREREREKRREREREIDKMVETFKSPWSKRKERKRKPTAGTSRGGRLVCNEPLKNSLKN